MKNSRALIYSLSLLIFLFKSLVSFGQALSIPGSNGKDTVAVYKDGIYAGMSRGKYVDEPYWGITRLKVENGILTEITFTIRDSSLHERFDGKYKKHFKGNPIFIQQSKNDWAGVKAYPRLLSEKQDISSLDAISGATWSYNIFRASVNEALKNGGAQTDTLSHLRGQ